MGGCALLEDMSYRKIGFTVGMAHRRACIVNYLIN